MLASGAALESRAMLAVETDEADRRGVALESTAMRAVETDEVEDGGAPRPRLFGSRVVRAGAAVAVALLLVGCAALLLAGRPGGAAGPARGTTGGTIGLSMRGGGGDMWMRASVPEPSEPLKVWQSMPNHVVLDEGEGIGNGFEGTVADCESACDNNADCNSFTTCLGGRPVKCYLKGKALTGHEPRKFTTWCSSHFKSGEYVPVDPMLLQPTAHGFTFYMYRGQTGPDFYPIGNVNTASIGGVLWYLHNEVIKTCDGSGFLAEGGSLGDRKFGIDRIRRVKVTMKPTAPLLQKGMNFGVLKSFDSGEDTGPHADTAADGVGTGFLSDPEWSKYGYHVGCGNIGEWPHGSEPGGWTSGPSYPDAVWYSLPGECPEMSYMTQTEQCRKAAPGGLCEAATGQGNCTFSYTEAGFIMLDDLVGITQGWGSRRAFCDQCSTEGGPWWAGGCSLEFWGENPTANIWTDRAGNAARVQAALAAFEHKYPDSQKESDMPPPTCDFNKDAYGNFPRHR